VPLRDDDEQQGGECGLDACGNSSADAELDVQKSRGG
jgi:hypothetical protein